MTIPSMLHQDENRYLPLLKNHCVRATLECLLVLFHRALCPPSKNRQKKALKNGMNLNNSFIFVEAAAFIPRFACGRASADMIFRRKNEASQGRFAPVQAYHIGSPLSSNFRGINAKYMLVCYWRQPIKRRLRATALSYGSPFLVIL